MAVRRGIIVNMTPPDICVALPENYADDCNPLFKYYSDLMINLARSERGYLAADGEICFQLMQLQAALRLEWAQHDAQELARDD